MKLLIAIQHRLALWNAPAWFGERLGREFQGLEVVQRNSYEGIETELADAEIVFTISLRPNQFTAGRKLRWIHAPTAAVHQFMFPELIESECATDELHGSPWAGSRGAHSRSHICAGEENPAGHFAPKAKSLGTTVHVD